MHVHVFMSFVVKVVFYDAGCSFVSFLSFSVSVTYMMPYNLLSHLCPRMMTLTYNLHHKSKMADV